VRARLAAGLTVMAACFREDVPVAVGVHQPVGDATEVAGVGTLPDFRRLGLGTAVTALLVEDARRRGLQTVFLSAGDDATARLYARLGFARVGTSCAAGP
jgi:ribosomal protein S18 acetylase RimI-like enzyme